MKYYITILLIHFLFIAGCSQAATTKETLRNKENLVQQRNKEKEAKEKHPNLTFAEKQNIVLSFVNTEVDNVTKLEEEALTSIAASSEQPTANPPSMLAELNSKISSFEKALGQVKGIKPQMKELEKVAAQMVLANETYYEILKLQKKALEKGDSDLTQKTSEKINDYLRMVEDYHFEIDGLAQQYKIHEISNI